MNKKQADLYIILGSVGIGIVGWLVGNVATLIIAFMIPYFSMKLAWNQSELAKQIADLKKAV